MRLVLLAAAFVLAGLSAATAATRPAYDLICHGDELLTDRDNDLPFATRLRIDPASDEFCQGDCPHPLRFTRDGPAISYVSDGRGAWPHGSGDDAGGQYTTVHIHVFASPNSGRVLYVEEDRDVCQNCRGSYDEVRSIHAICQRAAFTGFPGLERPMMDRSQSWGPRSSWRRDFGGQ